MKRTLLFIGLVLVLTAAIFAQNTTLPRLAVVEFSTNISSEKVKADATAVRDLVESHMVQTRKYMMVTRNEIDQLIANQRIQMSEITSTENIKKLELANISYLVTGSVNAMGNDYSVTVRVLDVSTGQFSHSESDFMGSAGRDLFNGIGALMTKFTSGMTAQGDRVTQTGQTYKVGDFGPAGGYIFYDKGVFSNGWRYLEAAPIETESYAQWGAYQHDVAGTRWDVGFGKRNTEIILERLRQLGETGCAAQLCASLNFNGHSDWFLPSKNELDLMYKNLKQKGLGDFGGSDNDWYWSSSQTDSERAWFQDLFGGTPERLDKNASSVSVRAVRAF